jgi:hypothetical protein
MRVRTRVAVVAAATIFGVPLCATGAAFAAELPRGPVTADTVASAQAEATAAAGASTDAARAAAEAQVALDAAKQKATAAANAAQAAADAYAANPTPENLAARDAAQAAAAQAAADQATAQTTFNDKSAAAAKAAADATAAADNAAREAKSFASLNKGTTAEQTTEIPDADPFPDNALHSGNVKVVGHARGGFTTTAAAKNCPAFNPTKCPGFSSLNFVRFENLGYDVMVANGTAGLSIWSLKDPEHPKWIAQVGVDKLNDAASAVAGAQNMSQFWEGENMTTDSRRKLVFLSRDQGSKGQFIVDIKDPWNPQVLNYSANRQGHTSTCLNDCRFLWSVGSVQTNSGPAAPPSPVSITDVRDPLHPFVYPLFGADLRRTGATSGSTHSVDVDFDGVVWVSGTGGVRGFYTEGLHKDPATGQDRYATPYAPIPYAGGSIAGNDATTRPDSAYAFMHNAYRFPNPIGDRPAGDVMLVTNENNDTDCATAGQFLIASLAGSHDATDNPTPATRLTRLAAYRTDGKEGQFHGTVPGVDKDGKPIDVTVGDCSAHWFTVKGNIVALGNYEQGTRFLDISDPRNPQQIGWYRVPARTNDPSGKPDIISSDTAGAYWHRGLVYVADYQRGVDVLKLDDSANRGKIMPKACWNSCSDDSQAVDPMTTSATGSAGGTVPATLSLTLSGAASFGTFTPGVGNDYSASATANVISTAGDAALSYSDPGHLSNGAFSLPEPLQVSVSKASWTGPVSNDAVTVTFKQHIGANDALRTGSYSKTLTFTLSTTNP